MIDLRELVPDPENYKEILASTFVQQCTVAIHEIKEHPSFKDQGVDFTFTISPKREESMALTGAIEVKFIDSKSILGGKRELVIVFITVGEVVIDLAGGHKIFSDTMLKARIIYELDQLFIGTKKDVPPIEPSLN